MQYVGIDVHKNSSQLCFVDENGEVCDACRLGVYRPAHRCSEQSRQLRTSIGVRKALVRTRSRYISVIRSHLRRDGYRVASGGVISFESRVRQIRLHQQLQERIEPLLVVLQELNRQIKAIDEQLEEFGV